MKKQIVKELFSAVLETHNTVQKKQHYLEIPNIVNRLAEQIISQTYKPGAYTCFAISDPTPREILAPSYPDRIVHRWLVNKMDPYIDKRFLSCSYANRTGKGHHRAVKQLQHYLQNPANKFYLKMDIESFFNSIDHEVLINLVKRWINKLPHTTEEKEMLRIATQTIITHNPTRHVVFTGDKEKLKIIPRQKSYFHNAPGKGLPLGNLSSQFFANIYLHELDFFVKQQLKVKYYLRYVDDIILLAENNEQLTYWRNALNGFLEKELKLNAHPKKTILQPARYGIDFLGYIVRKDYMLVRRRVVKSFKRKLYFYNNGEQKLQMLPEKKSLSSLQSCINSYYGIFRFADSYGLRKDLYLNRFGNLQKMFYANGWFQKIGIMKKQNQPYDSCVRA
ncbi:MAG: hypothetical protein EPN85_13605 [Bacteroidetes bacterium]|nr:MAG: hypothetical protein EPN85_13605 [Bacteroidota bacterium]